MKKGKTAVIVGAQWGDEGKGKIVDVLSEDFTVVARYAGGHNAGHTVIINGKKFILQLVPCGVLRAGCRSVIGNGVVLDPIAFLKEVGALRETGVQVDGNLFVSNRAHVILPYHRMIELASENAPGRVKIGTTSRGIGPAYEDKMGRRGLRVADLLDLEAAEDAHRKRLPRKEHDRARAVQLGPAGSRQNVSTSMPSRRRRSRPLSANGAALLNQAIADGESVMFEGAQGTMLDIDHGTYPFVTSSSATSGGAVIGTGVAPTAIDTVIGVTKAYCTRVGGGPFPSEILDGDGDHLRARGNEYGAVTGRPRRCGWLDLPLLRYAGMINGISWLVVTKLDVLDELAEIPVCVGYKINGKATEEIPAHASGYDQDRVRLYESAGLAHLHGGHHATAKSCRKAAREYLAFVEKESGARIGMVSTGPGRDQTYVCGRVFAAQIARAHRHREPESQTKEYGANDGRAGSNVDGENGQRKRSGRLFSEADRRPRARNPAA